MTPRESTMGIIVATAREHGVPLVDLLGSSRFGEHVRARHEAMRRVREARPHWSGRQIGQLFGRNYSTVYYALGLLARKPKDLRRVKGVEA